MKKISTQKAPQAIGPYSQAVVVGDFVYTSGQIALTPQGGEEVLRKGIREQTQQVLENLKAVLEAGGTSLDKVVKTTIFLKDINDFQIVNEIYATYFSHKPARSTIEVARLPKDALIEIEAIAVKE